MPRGSLREKAAILGCDVVSVEQEKANRKFLLRCRKCGNEFSRYSCSICYSYDRGIPMCVECRGEARSGMRFSGRRYENPPERLEEIRRKYADGVPDGEIERWINGL